MKRRIITVLCLLALFALGYSEQNMAKIASMSIDAPTSFAWYNDSVDVTVSWDASENIQGSCRTLIQIFVNGVIQPGNFGDEGFAYTTQAELTKTHTHLLEGIPDGIYDLFVNVKDRHNGVCGGQLPSSQSETISQIIGVDRAAPSIDPAADITQTTNDPAGAVVNYSTPAASDALSGIDSVSCLPASGSTFAVATTLVTCTATDLADNSTDTSFNVTINLDADSPIVNISFPIPGGQNGWYTDAVVEGTVTATDAISDVSEINCTGAALSGLSGIGTSSATGTLTLNTDGVHAISCTATDSLGNSGAANGSDNVTSIMIDSTPPTIMGSRTPVGNGFGWNNTDVDVSFDCSDALSGVAGGFPTGDTTLMAEGAGQSVTGTCEDNAGNASTNTVSDINIDKTAPIYSATPDPAPNSNGWNNTSVTFSYTCTDGLSGVRSQITSNSISSEGINQTLTAICDDKAGNSTQITVSANIDKTAPVITGSRTPAANANSWNNTDVDVSFSCTDTLSGVATGFPTGDTTLSAEGAGQFATGTCEDLAGNSASDTVGNVNIDKTPPVITSSRTPAANANGWNNTNVNVSFACSDTLSGVATGYPTGDSTFTSEGAGQSATGTCEDNAGNSSSDTVGDINIDTTAPRASIAQPLNGAVFLVNELAILSWFASDNVQIDTESGSFPNGGVLRTDEAGTFMASVTVVDLAGNRTSAFVQYQVTYVVEETGQVTVDGENVDSFIHNPIAGGGGDAESMVDASTFLIGEIISLRFQLFDRNGALISNARPVLSIIKVNIDEDGNESRVALPVVLPFAYLTDKADEASETQGGEYVLDVDTTDFETGHYEFIIQFGDGTSRILEINIE